VRLGRENKETGEKNYTSKNKKLGKEIQNYSELRTFK
jgi:hypothetical protein